jgi:hypothetical protein
MTRITLIIGIAVAALTMAAPAFGEGRLAGSIEPAPTTAPDWFERAIERSIADVPAAAPDWFERAAAASERRADVVRRGDDFVRLDPSTLPTPTVTASTSSSIEWDQLAIGFGLGIALAAGLSLAMRGMRAQPAH